MADQLGQAAGLAISAVLVALAAKFYGSKLVTTLRGGGRVDVFYFQKPDLVVAAALAGWFLFNVIGSMTLGAGAVGIGELKQGIVLFGILVAGILFGLLARKQNPIDVFGINREGGGIACGKGFVYLLVCYPLVGAALFLSDQLLGGKGNPQETVDLFLGAQNRSTAMWVIAAAVLVAPVAEELIFRGFLYGVAKRYFGTGFALAFSSLLFAAVHLHAPTFPALTILGICLVLAYEATGSLLVPMAMHACFNAFSLSALLLFPQMAG